MTDDTELAFRCVEMAVKQGAKGDPYDLAKQYFDSVNNIAAETEDEVTSDE